MLDSFWKRLATNKARCLEIRNRCYPEHEWPGEIYLDAIRERPGRAFLEIGCGRRAETVHRAADCFQRCVGVDPDCDGVKSELPNVELQTGDAAALPFPDETFDVIAMLDVAEHLPDPLAVIRECRRVMTPGARLIIQTPNQYFPVLVAGRLFSHRTRVVLNKIASGTADDDTFPVFYRANTLTALRRLGERAGLEIHTLRYLPHHPTYLLFSPIVYRVGVFCERIFRRIEFLAPLRPILQAIYTKPATAPKTTG